MHDRSHDFMKCSPIKNRIVANKCDRSSSRFCNVDLYDLHTWFTEFEDNMIECVDSGLEWLVCPLSHAADFAVAGTAPKRVAIGLRRPLSRWSGTCSTTGRHKWGSCSVMLIVARHLRALCVTFVEEGHVLRCIGCGAHNGGPPTLPRQECPAGLRYFLLSETSRQRCDSPPSKP